MYRFIIKNFRNNTFITSTKRFSTASEAQKEGFKYSKNIKMPTIVDII